MHEVGAALPARTRIPVYIRLARSFMYVNTGLAALCGLTAGTRGDDREHCSHSSRISDGEQYGENQTLAMEVGG